MASLGQAVLNETGAADSVSNETGAAEIATLVTGGASHFSFAQSTTRHAHYAWKVHIGLDAPVWLRSDGVNIQKRDGIRAVVVPPSVLHETGACGWSLALFIAPGRWGSAPMGPRPRAVPSNAVPELLRAATFWGERPDPSPLLEEVSALVCEAGQAPLDSRVRDTLQRLGAAPHTELQEVASQAGLSLDRLSRLTVQGTGMSLRRHALWSRLMNVLSTPASTPNLAAAAANAGFADHAHMTRTYRAFLGRAPSDFKAPPRVQGTWWPKPQ